jgi:CubicO group peptidase (beta-lactamase class C family)
VTTPDAATLQQRLDALIAKHKIVGASVAVLSGDDVVEAAAGVINRNTGVEATTDTLFQIGSISKVWTASLVMMAVDEGALDLDEPIVTYLPEFKVADPDVTKKVTLRHLLSHSSGIGGDHILETGRGDDTLERYVETCAELGQEYDLGATMSYCNTGYSLAGRILEKTYEGPDGTSKVWDQILRERIIQPLGLTHTNTLPEEALLFRTAAGHISPPGAEEPMVAPFWVLPRSAGPAGLINATAADLLTFVRMHLDEGRAADGTQLLSPGAVKLMQEPQIDVPDRWTLGDKWGIGWILFDWDGHRVYGHDGNTVGQSAYLRVLPEARLAVTLLTNGGAAGAAFRSLVTELFAEAAGVAVPPMPAVPDSPADVELSNYEGAFRRLNVESEIARNDDGGLSLTVRSTGPLAERLPEEQRTQTVQLVPVDETLFVTLPEEKEGVEPTPPMPVVFFDFEDGRPKRYHMGARAMTRAGT